MEAEAALAADITGLPEYEALETEMAKLASAGEAGSLDWDAAERLARNLAARGRDLKVSGYLCAILARNRRQEGLAEGLRAYRALLEEAWETLTPARVRARRNAVQWLLDRLLQTGAAWPPATWPREARQALMADLRAIDAFLGDHLEDAPLMHTFIQQAGGWVMEAAEAEPAAPPVPAFTAPAPEPPPETAAADPAQALGTALAHCGQAAGILLEADPADPVPYVLNRMAAWLPVRNLPPAEAGRTRIPAPSAQTFEALAAARAAGNARIILLRAEALLGDHIFWLDLNRLAVTALDQLGHGEAARRAEAETRAFVARMPGVETLAFADGTPFADPAHRAWLRPPAARPLSVEEAGETGPDLDRLGRESLAGGRRGFRARIALCALLVREGKGRAAGALARDLLASLERLDLAAWEPALAVEALRAALDGFQAEGLDPAHPLPQSAYQQLVPLDPAQALDLA